MATFYVRKGGNDGTAVADNIGLPWRNIGAAFNAAGDGDLVDVGAGTWSPAELENSGGQGYAFIDNATSMIGAGTDQTIIQSDSNVANLRWQSNLDGQTVNISGFRCESNGTTANAYLYFNNTGTSGTPFVANVSDIELSAELALLGAIYVTGSGAIDLTVDGYLFAGDQANINPNHRASAIYAPALVTNSLLSINNVTLDLANRLNSSPIIDIDTSLPGVSCEINGTSGTVQFASSFPTQECQIQRILNIDDAVIDGQNKTITCTTLSSSGTVSIAVIDCDNAALTANRGKIKNVIGEPHVNGGFGVRIGHDPYGGGTLSDLANDGHITNCRIIGNTTFRENVGHGIFFGYCSGGNSDHNYTEQCGLSLLCKGSTGGGHFANECVRFGRPSDGVGTAIQSIGCAGTRFFGNYIQVGSDSYGEAFLASEDDESFIDNANVDFESNVFDVVSASPAGTNLISVLNNQIVSLRLNTYQNVALITNATPYSYLGSNIDVANWQTTEVTANFSEGDSTLNRGISLLSATYTLEIEASSTLYYEEDGGVTMAAQFPAGRSLDRIGFDLSGGGRAIPQSNITATFPTGNTNRLFVTLDITGIAPTAGQTLELNARELGLQDSQSQVAIGKYAFEDFTVVGVS